MQLKTHKTEKKERVSRADTTSRWETEKQLTITATTEALEVYGERNGE